MGFFDESICECCVCPMQRVLMQLRGETVSIDTTSDEGFEITVDDAKNFILFTSDEFNNEFFFPICNITAVEFPSTNQIDLSPSKTSFKGECSCCEDPANRLLNRLSKNTSFNFIYLDTNINGFIIDIGEGIVIIQDELDATILKAISICKLAKILPSTPVI
ncbi:hypothetical protein [Chengkuizengella axinellae]|uniref:Uncharacterized protein n=1 Tax=Chengkuizengella axinellae TaxID=3064388 RepID=A0ABT9J2F7_9BACL|nr:hypothetical protein [Chengkuizengella sp. 2205SS18-9]MDP5275765.1 hypothetical protein [Chengkuizengella sp. 2205SS18-9]